MLRLFQEQVARVDRLLDLVNAKDQEAALGGILAFQDVLVFACQGMWHIRDWVLNDPYFAARDKAALRREIESNQYLLVCADLANGSKHFVLDRPHTSIRESDRQGISVVPGKGIFQVYYYLESNDRSGPFHGMEIRAFLTACRTEWQAIIDRHYMSEVDGHVA
ncbi:hypothetical protein [Dyella sp. S184]|uniref:hypothetical protein n=1 Tax=Dyella sp. S184 TaxID=1641862 RepID=UPI00131E9DAF|nr:hypothetical protein [Dyella sp. S184]